MGNLNGPTENPGKIKNLVTIVRVEMISEEDQRKGNTKKETRTEVAVETLAVVLAEGAEVTGEKTEEVEALEENILPLKRETTTTPSPNNKKKNIIQIHATSISISIIRMLMMMWRKV